MASGWTPEDPMNSNRPENEDGVIQDVIIVVHVAFAQVRESGERLDGEAGFLEDVRQAVHLLLPRLSFDFQNFGWFIPLATY